MKSKDEFEEPRTEGGEIARWYKKYNYAMLHTAVRYVRDLTIAEDIVQMVFENLLMKKQCFHFENERMSKAFILKAVKNQCIDFLRAEGKRQALVESMEQEIDKDDFIVDSPLSGVLWQEEREELRWLIENKLKGKYRLALYYHYFFEMTMREISEYLNVDERTVAVWVARARKMLKEWILEKREKEGRKQKEDGKEPGEDEKKS